MSFLWTNFGLAKAADVRGATEGREWEIFITASTPRQDHENEIVLQKALIDAAPFYLTKGRLTWEHVTESTRYEPSIYIGEPLDVKFPADGRTLVKGWIYQSLNKPKAREAWGILESGGTLYASIGGYKSTPQKRHDGVGIVSKVMWTHTALTPFPMNEDAEASHVPLAEFAKALGTADAGPMVMEDFEGTRLGGLPAFTAKWHALAEQLAQQFGYDDDKAHQYALAILIKRGEARHAFVAYSMPSSSSHDTEKEQVA